MTARLIPTEEAEPGQTKQHDVEIFASLPGVGRIVLATLLAEAFAALQRRDYATLRSLTGVAPVTKRSGRSCIVVRKQACHDRLANAMYHWARVSIQHDLSSRLKYAALRSRGHSHGRALRSVADRLLNVACALLKAGTTFNPSLATQKTSC
ncbi:IS110 family transposase [Chelativorans sp. ZYF759]|uniref:IS110 family transposase n=1 Tax=Chelativorans sp. ZYF759 TaxID=2692213 RepID=UPI001FEF98FF|nr:IS110 family transposase [Chelativorans sp. ZYF759]